MSQPRIPSQPTFTPGEARTEAVDAATLELKPVATSASILARLLNGEDVPEGEIENSAESVSDFLRRLAEDSAYHRHLAEDVEKMRRTQESTPCPDWCAIVHKPADEEYVRRHTASVDEPVETITGGPLGASVVQFVDLLTGHIRPSEVQLDDKYLTPGNAAMLADQLLVAAAVAGTGSAREVHDTVDSVVSLATYAEPAALKAPRPGCQPWCADPDASCGGECHAEGVEIPATAGFWQHHEEGMRCARVEATAIITEAGDPAVDLRVSGPTALHTSRDAWAHLTPAEARRIGRALLAQADIAEQVRR